MIYPGIFSSLLRYGSQIWGQSNKSISKMEKLQNKPLRIISFKHIQDHRLIPYIKCDILKFADNIKLSNFLFAHDSIKSNLPTSLCDSITLVNNKYSHTSRNQEANQVNIPTVRTKTSGSNRFKSKFANIWNYLNLY